MKREEAIKELNKAFEPAFANYIITALQEGATVSDKGEDAISRNAMLDYQQYLHGKMSNEENHKLWEFIKDLPSVTSIQKWIPVSERLPEPRKLVVCYITTGATETYFIAFWNDIQKAWEEGIGGCRLLERDLGYEVIAWMPLPEPYKAEMEFDETKIRCDHD